MVRALVVVLSCLALTAPLPFADAEANAAELPVHVSLGAGTNVPLDLSARLDVELPGRFQLMSTLGYMPRLYTDTLNDASVSYGWYDETTAQLIRSALQDSLVWKVMAGWRPVEDSGFYFLGGYQVLTLGGGLTGAEIVAAVTGNSLGDLETERLQVDAQSTLHMLDLELGWRWRLVAGFELRAALGGFYTFGSSTSLSATGLRPALRERVAPYLREGQQYLNDVYQSYVHSPYVGLYLSYRLF